MLPWRLKFWQNSPTFPTRHGSILGLQAMEISPRETCSSLLKLKMTKQKSPFPSPDLWLFLEGWYGKKPAPNHRTNTNMDRATIWNPMPFIRLRLESIRELVQVIKIVSDNPTQPVDKFSPKEAPNLIIQHLPAIDALVMQMDQHVKVYKPTKHWKSHLLLLIKHIHFHFTRSHQLYNLVKHAKLLDLDMNIVQELARSSVMPVMQSKKFPTLSNPTGYLDDRYNIC